MEFTKKYFPKKFLPYDWRFITSHDGKADVTWWNIFNSESWGRHGGAYKNLFILGCYAVQEGLLGLLDSYQSTRQNILDDLAVLTNWLSELTKDRAVILEWFILLCPAQRNFHKIQVVGRLYGFGIGRFLFCHLCLVMNIHWHMRPLLTTYKISVKRLGKTLKYLSQVLLIGVHYFSGFSNCSRKVPWFT